MIIISHHQSQSEINKRLSKFYFIVIVCNDLLLNIFFSMLPPSCFIWKKKKVCKIWRAKIRPWRYWISSLAKSLLLFNNHQYDNEKNNKFYPTRKTISFVLWEWASFLKKNKKKSNQRKMLVNCVQKEQLSL